MTRILKTATVVALIYLIALGAAFIMSARVESLDRNGVNTNISVSLK